MDILRYLSGLPEVEPTETTQTPNPQEAPWGGTRFQGVPVLIRRTRRSGDCSADLNNQKIKEDHTETSKEASGLDHQ